MYYVQPCEEESHDTNEDLPMTAEQKQREKERLQAVVSVPLSSSLQSASPTSTIFLVYAHMYLWDCTRLRDSK